jgi:CheY-like chemotaxis protein
MTCQSVLIVEDEQTIRETLQLTLEIEGYSVYTAENGKDGLEQLRQIPKPCLILLDLMMPVMNGWQFVEALHENTVLTTIPVVVVTAFNERTRSIRADGVMKKPVDLDALLATVKRYCS